MQQGPVTRWLARWRAGDRRAVERLVPLVYDELRQLASRQLRVESPARTLSATVLVHEVYLRLLRHRQLAAADREAFLGIAGQTMRRILVDHARTRVRQKRGGDVHPVPLEFEYNLPLLSDREVDEVLAIDVALDRLALRDERAHQVIECRVFGGLTMEETAKALGMSSRSIQRTWTAARAWLRKAIRPTPAAS